MPTTESLLSVFKLARYKKSNVLNTDTAAYTSRYHNPPTLESGCQTQNTVHPAVLPALLRLAIISYPSLVGDSQRAATAELDRRHVATQRFLPRNVGVFASVLVYTHS